MQKTWDFGLWSFSPTLCQWEGQRIVPLFTSAAVFIPLITCSVSVKTHLNGAFVHPRFHMLNSSWGWKIETQAGFILAWSHFNPDGSGTAWTSASRVCACHGILAACWGISWSILEVWDSARLNLVFLCLYVLQFTSVAVQTFSQYSI